jgi:hypothetical protein
MAHVGHGGNDGRLFAGGRTLGDHRFQFLPALLHLLQIGKQMIQL